MCVRMKLAEKVAFSVIRAGTCTQIDMDEIKSAKMKLNAIPSALRAKITTHTHTHTHRMR